MAMDTIKSVTGLTTGDKAEIPLLTQLTFHLLRSTQGS